MKGFPKTFRTAALAAGLALAGVAQGATIEYYTWNTCEGGTDNKCAGPSGNNTLTESVRGFGSSTPGIGVFDAIESAVNTVISSPADGDDLQVRAYNSGTTGLNFISSTQLSIFSGGLGAGYESSWNGEHAVDNIGFDEFLVLKLPEKMSVTSFMIGWPDESGNSRPDINVWVGTTTEDLLAESTFDEQWNRGGFLNTLANASWQAFTFLNVDDLVVQSFASAPMGNYVIVGARHEYCSILGCLIDKGNDTFKLLQLTAEYDPGGGGPPQDVSEPGTLAILGLGLAGIGALRRRKLMA